ncbi:uncharacterized protein PHALS_14222 [Plasmopara halstedii]|uniref:Uncharacterized protein n=1 Tax=Plasmopara halstedii TaxID=4781 RepID=A0A0P1AQV5_PLAHL|nr:uncharacterized protein PHALS_14222 [Plasmopara halstedii]CEG43943.1 hypothetical protein PHALS_14222 [Plasmopara halstedii]|eukprot:XP_024580312.1 hypothetical protein PHALS_14222 [Plasmopara halstedii]
MAPKSCVIILRDTVPVVKFMHILNVLFAKWRRPHQFGQKLHRSPTDLRHLLELVLTMSGPFTRVHPQVSRSSALGQQTATRSRCSAKNRRRFKRSSPNRGFNTDNSKMQRCFKRLIGSRRPQLTDEWQCK